MLIVNVVIALSCHCERSEACLPAGNLPNVVLSPPKDEERVF
ncbi:MAG: hypothetical protein ABIJ27_07520 [Candidatus Omnitrophota bacterium]